MTSVRKPLPVTELPEILYQILGYLKCDSRSLASAILVNKLWFECAIRFLWYKPPLGALLALPKHRLQFYASQIYDLDLSAARVDDHEKLKDVQFTSARKVCIDAYRVEIGRKTYVNQYLQPQLEELLVFGADLEPDFFEHLKTNCRRLNKFLLDSPGCKVTADMLLDYLQASPALEHLEFEVGLDNLLTDDVLAHFGSCNNLESLVLAKVTVGMMETMCQGGSQPFDSLVHFGSTGISAPAISVLAGYASKTLEMLELYINDKDASLFHALSLCPHLTLLRLEFPQMELEAQSHHFMKLQTLKKMESLYLDSSNCGNLIVRGFGDSEFDKLFSNFPLLTTLEFCPHTSITYASIRSLSKHCPLLETLITPLSLDVLDLNKDPRLAILPELNSLNISNLIIAPDRETDDLFLLEVVAGLRNIFPKLEELVIDDPEPNEFAWKVGARYDELYNPGDSSYKRLYFRTRGEISDNEVSVDEDEDGEGEGEEVESPNGDHGQGDDGDDQGEAQTIANGPL